MILIIPYYYMNNSDSKDYVEDERLERRGSRPESRRLETVVGVRVGVAPFPPLSGTF